MSHELIDKARYQAEADIELWEFEYKDYQYLKELSDEDVIARYKYLQDNRQFLFNAWAYLDDDCHHLEKYTFWNKKVYQTSLELTLRKIEPPIIDFPVYLPLNKQEAGLFRYSKLEYLESFLEGTLSLVNADEYAKNETLTEAQKDKELQRESISASGKAKIILPNGKESIPIGPITYKRSTKPYYLTSFAKILDPNLAPRFNCMHCVVIHDQQEFFRRVKMALIQQTGTDRFLESDVTYFDPCLDNPSSFKGIPTEFLKPLSYAYQQELRLACRLEATKTERYNLGLGSIQDIAELIEF